MSSSRWAVDLLLQQRDFYGRMFAYSTKTIEDFYTDIDEYSFTCEETSDSSLLKVRLRLKATRKRDGFVSLASPYIGGAPKTHDGWANHAFRVVVYEAEPANLGYMTSRSMQMKAYASSSNKFTLNGFTLNEYVNAFNSNVITFSTGLWTMAGQFPIVKMFSGLRVFNTNLLSGDVGVGWDFRYSFRKGVTDRNLFLPNAGNGNALNSGLNSGKWKTLRDCNISHFLSMSGMDGPYSYLEQHPEFLPNMRHAMLFEFEFPQAFHQTSRGNPIGPQPDLEHAYVDIDLVYYIKIESTGVTQSHPLNCVRDAFDTPVNHFKINFVNSLGPSSTDCLTYPGGYFDVGSSVILEGTWGGHASYRDGPGFSLSGVANGIYTTMGVDIVGNPNHGLRSCATGQNTDSGSYYSFRSWIIHFFYDCPQEGERLRLNCTASVTYVFNNPFGDSSQHNIQNFMAAWTAYDVQPDVVNVFIPNLSIGVLSCQSEAVRNACVLTLEMDT